MEALYNSQQPLFMMNIVKADHMTQMKNTIIDNRNEISKAWYNLDIYNKVPDLVIYIFIVSFAYIFNYDKDLISSLVMVYGTFSQSQSNMFDFLNCFNNDESAYCNYLNFWKNKKMTSPVPQIDVPKVIKVTECDITVGHKKVTVEKQIEIKQGDKICFKGKSGGGKSTFLNGFTSRINGITFDFGSSKQIKDNIAYMFQNMAKFYNFDMLSITDLFTNCDKQKIEDIVTLFGLDEKFKQVGLTEKLCGLSGGEQNRFAIASQFVHYEKCDIMIFDELEQGTDPKQAYTIIDNIIKKYKNKTIIFVTHLENTNKYDWNQKWFIESDGIVSVEKPNFW
jgi:ABC-type lipoprotein export system ATPase subunit